MSIVSKLMAGSAIILAMSFVPALADGTPKKAYSGHHDECDTRFNGAFVGVHAGSATLNNRTTDRDGLNGVLAGLTSSELTHVQDGLTFGGSVGYNVQKCAAVFGIVADLSWADLDSNRGYNNALAGGILGRTFSHGFEWYGSVRSRAGLAMDNLMIYTTGGVAFANSSMRVQVPLLAVDTTVFDNIRVGWVAGVGTEYAITDKISLTSEALYYDFGTKVGGVTVPAVGGLNFALDDHQSMWVARMGVNIKLGERAAHYEPMK